MSEYKFKQNDAVRWESGGKEYVGLIKGVATTEMPVIGRMWIVDLVQAAPFACLDPEYPFSCIAIPENQLTKMW